MEAHTPQELSLSVAEKVIFSINVKDVETDLIFLKVKKEISDLSIEIDNICSDIRALTEKVEIKNAIKPHVMDLLLRIINYL